MIEDDTVGWHPQLNGHGWEWANFIQMSIISTTVSKNPLEEMEQPS